MKLTFLGETGSLHKSLFVLFFAVCMLALSLSTVSAGKYYGDYYKTGKNSVQTAEDHALQYYDVESESDRYVYSHPTRVYNRESSYSYDHDYYYKYDADERKYYRIGYDEGYDDGYYDSRYDKHYSIKPRYTRQVYVTGRDSYSSYPHYARLHPGSSSQTHVYYGRRQTGYVSRPH